MSEALIRRRYLYAMRQSVEQLWGSAGLVTVARALPEGVRSATVDAPVMAEEWLPATHAMAWFEAVWETTAQRKPDAFSAFMACQTDFSFGRVRRFLLSHATPPVVISRAATLWRDDNSRGQVVATAESPTSAIAELTDHIYTTTPLSRMAITELFRVILTRCRAKEVSARGVLTEGGALRMRFVWRP